MCFLRSLMVLYRIMLAAFFVMCLSGSAVLTCWEAGEQEKTCTCEQVKSLNSIEILVDGQIEMDFSTPEDDLQFELLLVSSFYTQSKIFHVQIAPSSTSSGLNSPPPELV